MIKICCAILPALLHSANKGDRMATVQEIEHAMKIAAKVVAMYGDAYLPTFQRLHSELQKAKELEANKMLALKLAMSYSEAG